MLEPMKNYCVESYRNWRNDQLLQLCRNYEGLQESAQKALKLVLEERGLQVVGITLEDNPNLPSKTGNVSGKRRGNYPPNS